jgi:predicted amidophosphoribosyltransferase
VQVGAAPNDVGHPAVMRYEGGGRRLVLALKYGNARPVVQALAGAMARRVRHERVDVVTWAPTSAVRRRRRGYDQAELLARAVAWRLGVPCRRLLHRLDDPRGPQTGRSRVERLDGPAFVARRRVRGAVLVVDDVVTTGATLRAAEAALLAGGARSVRTVAAAATLSSGAA